MTRWNPSNYPSGGWKYTTPEGLRISGGSLQKLIRAVAKALDTQEPDAAQIVDEYLCNTHPNLCRGSKPAAKPLPVASNKGSKDPLYRAVAAHVDRSFNVPADQCAHDAEAERRLNICRECPAAKAADFGCPRCAEALVQARRLRLKDIVRTSMSANKAPICSVLGLDCLIASRFGPLTSSLPLQRVPTSCWVRITPVDVTAEADQLETP